MEVRFSPYAERDLAEIRAGIETPAVAGVTIARILQSIAYLGNFPRLGRAGSVRSTLEFAIHGLPYKAVYRIEGYAVRILSIVHTSRQFPL